MPGSREILRPVGRFVAAVLMTSGVLMLIDAGLTVTWQEPVSAFFAGREQDRLGDELESAAREFSVPGPAVSPAELRRQAREWGDRAKEGRPIGRIDIPSLDRRYVTVEGTKLGTLRKGPGHYPKTSMPGEGGTVAIAGHRTTYGAPFRTVNKLKAGRRIELEMPYGTFTYTVERTQIVPPTATWITRRVKGRERLVLSACHPLYSAAKRIIVFARLSSAEPR